LKIRRQIKKFFQGTVDFVEWRSVGKMNFFAGMSIEKFVKPPPEI